jgi:hypothetical protein
VVIVVATGWLFAQNIETRAPTTPRIILDVPDDVNWVRYSLSGSVGAGAIIAIIKVEPNLRQYVIDAMIGDTPAQQAKIVMYAPGCQFDVYNLDLAGTSDTSVQFECRHLPTEIVHGFLPPTQIPLNAYTTEKNLEIVGELEDSWVCDYFLQSQRGSTTIMTGSCLESSVPLGIVGEIDPAGGGSFDITIPDFTLDPVFKGIGDIPRVGEFGVIKLALRAKNFPRVLETIMTEDAPGVRGLSVQTEYRNPVKFTPGR